MLPQVIYIDLLDATEPQAKEILLSGIGQTRAKPNSPPKFPGPPEHTNSQQPIFPGSLPAIWNVPYQRNPNFIGRDTELDILSDALNKKGAAILTQAITGLGGIGKTQLAVEYAYRNLTNYDLIWWVRAETTAMILSDFTALAAKLELPEKDSEKRFVIEAVLRRVGQMNRYLIIFDNATSVEGVRDYLPQAQSGHVLITSRNINWTSTAQKLEVKVLERNISAEFLSKRTRQCDEGKAIELATELGDLPLALEQAGAYIEATGISLSDYLTIYRSWRQELWREEHRPLDYPETVATTWLISLQAVRQDSTIAADLLSLFAFFGPDAIPQWLLRENAKHLPDTLATGILDDLSLNRAVATLRRFSLIELDVSAHTFSVHRLVQAVTRDRLEVNDQRKLILAIMLLLDAAFPQESEDIRVWPVCAEILQHSLTIIDHCERLSIIYPETARLLNQCGLYSLGRAELPTAKTAFERALKMYEAMLGPRHSHIATVMSNLGRVLHDSGDLADALKLSTSALIMSEQTCGTYHPNVSRELNNLGSVRKSLNDIIGARSCFEKALRIDLQLPDPNPASLSRDNNNLGMLLLESGDPAGARPYFEEALRIDKIIYKTAHPRAAIRLNNYGGLLQILGDLDGARHYYEQALTIDQECFDSNHPNVALRLCNIGGIIKRRGGLTEARSYYEQALEIYEQTLGMEHPSRANTLNDLALLLIDLDEAGKAREYLEEALRIDEAKFGNENDNLV